MEFVIQTRGRARSFALLRMTVQGGERRVASRRSCVRRLRVNSAKDLALVFAWKGRTEARCFAAVKIAPILG